MSKSEKKFKNHEKNVEEWAKHEKNRSHITRNFENVRLI